MPGKGYVHFNDTRDAILLLPWMLLSNIDSAVLIQQYLGCCI